jgi:hypothetical protein
MKPPELPPFSEETLALLDAERSACPTPGASERVLARLMEKGVTRRRRLGVIRAPSMPGWRRWLGRLGAGQMLFSAPLAMAVGMGGTVAGIGAALLLTRSVPKPTAPRGGPMPLVNAKPMVQDSSNASIELAPASGTESSPPAISAPHRVLEPPRLQPIQRTKPVAEGPSMDELRLLDDARQSISEGYLSTALGLLAEHERLYPTSQLAEERQALKIREAIRAGSGREARRWLDVFRSTYPQSPFLGELQQAVETVEKGSP